MKRSFFQAAVVSILLYGCTTSTLTKRLKKKLDGNYTRMLRAILNKSWRQHPQGTNYTATCLPPRKLSKLDEPDTQDTAGEARANSSVMYSYGPPHMAKQKQDDQLEHTYNNYVGIRDVALKTCQRRWTIGRSGERESGMSVQAARHDDDDDRSCINCICVLYKSFFFSSLMWKDRKKRRCPWKHYKQIMSNNNNKALFGSEFILHYLASYRRSLKYIPTSVFIHILNARTC